MKISSLFKKYGKNEVLKGIDLSFNKGVIYGIVGENGAGKTTLFRCISGMEQYKGNIEYNEGILKNVIGFLPTNPFMISKITGREYLKLLLNARVIKIDNLNKKNIFDLPLDKYADTYSTGMKKKLALTGVLIQNNEIYVLDEPFNGVDIQSNILIKEILIKLKELDKIVILSSHIFSILSDTCDILHHLKDGKIVNSVTKDNFETIENEIKNIGIGNKIDNMGLK
jgi:ABC-2 type transport system ATP-binding protein